MLLTQITRTIRPRTQIIKFIDSYQNNKYKYTCWISRFASHTLNSLQLPYCDHWTRLSKHPLIKSICNAFGWENSGYIWHSLWVRIFQIHICMDFFGKSYRNLVIFGLANVLLHLNKSIRAVSSYNLISSSNLIISSHLISISHLILFRHYIWGKKKKNNGSKPASAVNSLRPGYSYMRQ